MKKITSLLCALFLLNLIVPIANAAISISPILFEYENEAIEPGAALYDVINVTNTSDSTLTIFPEVDNFYYDENGDMRFGSSAIADMGLKDWLEIDSNKFNLSANESKEIPFSIRIPKNAAPGGYYGVLFFNDVTGINENMQENETNSVIGRVGALVLLELGETSKSGEIKNVYISEEINYTDITTTTISIEYLNTGNVHYIPNIDIEIYDDQDKLVDSLKATELRVFPETPKIIKTVWNHRNLSGEYKAVIKAQDGDGNLLPEKTLEFEVDSKKKQEIDYETLFYRILRVFFY